MMKDVPSLLLYLFFGITALVALIRFVRGKQWKTLELKPLKTAWKPFVIGIVPMAACLIAGKLGNLSLPDAAPYFGGAALLAMILSQLNFAGETRSFILLLASVGLTFILPTEARNDGTMPNAALMIVSTMGGLLFWKFMENMLRMPESRLDDVLPALVWLGALDWAQTGLSGNAGLICKELILCTLLAGVLIRWVQTVLLHEDRVYLKRIMLSLTGGLALLILITKVMLAVKFTHFALLGGFGFLLAYLLQSLDRSVDQSPVVARSMKNILLVGIATLVATRLFGMQGLLMLAAAMTVAPVPGSAAIAGMFWISRILLQLYVSVYNPNVTGINLMHPYTNAALYAGFVLVMLGSLFIRDLKNRKVLTSILLLSTVVLPCAANFFLHPEPTSSLLAALGVTGILMAMLAPAVYKDQSADQENLTLLPAMAAACAIASGEFIELGNNASSHERIVVLASIGGFILLVALAINFVFVDRDTKPSASTPSEPEPNGSAA